MINKKDVQKAAKKVGKVVTKASEEAYEAVGNAAKPKLKALKKATAPAMKETRIAIKKQVAKGVKGAKSLAKDALNSTGKSLQRAAKKI